MAAIVFKYPPPPHDYLEEQLANLAYIIYICGYTYNVMTATYLHWLHWSDR